MDAKDNAKNSEGMKVRKLLKKEIENEVQGDKKM